MPATQIAPASVIQRDEQYYAVADEIKSTVKEYVANSRWLLVEGYWSVGKLIRERFTGNGMTKLLQALGADTGLSETTLWYCVQVFDKYPQLDNLPEGKNITWNKLITKYLPEAKKTAVLPELCEFCQKDKYEDGQMNAVTIPAMQDDGRDYHVHKPCLWFFLNKHLSKKK